MNKADKIREQAIKQLTSAIDALKWQQVGVAKTNIAQAGKTVAKYEFLLRMIDEREANYD